MVSWEKLERQQPRYVQRHKQQLRNEIACLQSLNHANIVRLQHHQNTPKWFIMVLEFCAGGDLSQAIKRRKSEPVDEGVARYLVKQLADGLKAMRELNWVHRFLILATYLHEIRCFPRCASLNFVHGWGGVAARRMPCQSQTSPPHGRD